MNNIGREHKFTPEYKSISPKDNIQKIISSENLDSNRKLIKKIARELKISYLDCAAALTFLCFNDPYSVESLDSLSSEKTTHQPKNAIHPKIRLVRYRLDIGLNQAITLDELKKVLVEESGVDINNITNVRINDDYTLIDLPDEMPQEIFHHLKTVEINNQKLDIKRLKYRNKKRSNRKFQKPNQTANTSPPSKQPQIF